MSRVPPMTAPPAPPQAAMPDAIIATHRSPWPSHAAPIAMQARAPTTVPMPKPQVALGGREEKKLFAPDAGRYRFGRGSGSLIASPGFGAALVRCRAGSAARPPGQSGATVGSASWLPELPPRTLGRLRSRGRLPVARSRAVLGLDPLYLAAQRAEGGEHAHLGTRRQVREYRPHKVR